MKEYRCDKCLKNFNKKSNYMTHINRKNPCERTQVDEKVVQKPNINIPNDTIGSHFSDKCESDNTIGSHFCDNLIPDNTIGSQTDLKKSLDTMNIRLQCIYCKKIFTRQNNLNRHISLKCKVKNQRLFPKTEKFSSK